MANNRLYLVNTETKEYILLAKGHGNGWMVGNIEVYQKFLADNSEFLCAKQNLIVGSELDDEFYNKWIDKGKNYNESGNWEYL